MRHPAGSIAAGARILISAFALLAGCAKVEAPSGGPIDRDEPRVVGLHPDSGSVGVRPDTISILFSKKMNRRTVRDWLFVTPPLAISEAKWRGERLDLLLESPADTGRTYVILLGSEAIDARGNPLGPWQASFATGSRLDDGAVEGKVRSGRLRAPGSYVYAWVWEDGEDSLRWGTTPPLRIGQARKDGTFRIGALPRDLPLRICALYDARRDRAYDAEEDLWGCLDDPLVLADSVALWTGLELVLAMPDEPGSIQGTVGDSSCVGVGVEALRRLRREADSLAVRIGRRKAAAADSLVGFASAAQPADTARVLRRLAEIDTLRAAALLDSSRCAAPIVVRLFEADSVLVAEGTGSGGFLFRDIPSGRYRIAAFRDRDGDGRPGPREGAGAYPHPVDLRPGRETKGLDFSLKLLAQPLD